jgi:cob(I)alamin adenosyltransferase
MAGQRETFRITRVYTRSGDAGLTGLAGGQRVPKQSLRVETYGGVDEFSAALGWARTALAEEAASFVPPEQAPLLDAHLRYMQNLLFTIGGELATLPADRHPLMPTVQQEHLEYLEKACDSFNESLPPLKDFILAGGGSRTAAALHLARTICRRAERSACALAAQEEVNPLMIAALNRLSDALFVIARWTDRTLGREEAIWVRDLQPPPFPAR